MAVALCAAAAVGAQLDMVPEAWDNMNPLGGTFMNGVYDCRNEASHSFAVSKAQPLSSNVTVTATYRPERGPVRVPRTLLAHGARGVAGRTPGI